MFENLNGDSATDKKIKTESASDQVIIVRKFGQKIPFEIAGLKINVKAPSFNVSAIAQHYRNKYSAEFLKRLPEFREALIKVAENNPGLMSKVFSNVLEGNDDEKTLAEIEVVMEMNVSTSTSNIKFERFTDEYCLRLVQLIILDAANPDWIDDHDTYDMPSQQILDDAIPLKKLYKKAGQDDVAALLELYRGLDTPADNRKKNLRAMGYNQAEPEKKEDENSPGRGFGHASPNTTPVDSGN